MIIVADKNKVNVVFFPQNKPNTYSDKFMLLMIDRATNVCYDFFDLEDLHSVTYGFYTFSLDFSKLPQGEYEYTIYGTSERANVPYNDERDEIFGTGLIRLNELEQDFTIHNENRTYVTYNG